MDESTQRSQHPGSLGQAFLWALLPSLVLFLIASPAVSLGQVVTNITPTTIAPLDLGTNVDTVGSTTQITGGTRPGSGTNLFHSFDSFTLGTGDTAHFLNDMQLPTTNIFGRIIGGEVSTIDGTLRTNNPLNAADPMNFGAANLWLVNPSGLLLGPNARVEVGGSVSMSTANYLRFEGTSALFDMLASPASLGPLSVAPVAAFGFLGPEPPAPMTVEGGIIQVPANKTLSFVGGDISFQAHELLDGTIQAANFRAEAGQLNLVSVASPGEVLLPSAQTGPNITGAAFTTMGTVTIKEGSVLDVSGQLDEFGTPIGNGNSGTVFVRGGQLVIDASTIQVFAVGAENGASTAVDIHVSQDVALSSQAGIFVATSGSGRVGDVVIEAENVRLSESSTFFTGSFGPGSGGDLLLNVGALRLLDGSQIVSTSGVEGAGGNVTVQAADSVTLSGDSSLRSDTFGSGAGGQLAITSKSLTMDGAATTINTSVSDVGRGGDIVVSVQHARLSGGATITTLTASADLNAPAGGTVTVQGLQGAGSMADSVILSGLNSGINSDTFGPGRSGDVAVHAKTVSLTDGAVILAGTQITSAAGGNVTIDAGSVGISGGSLISSQASNLDAGKLTITANALTLDKGSIVANTSSQGQGGDVVLNVGRVSLSNGATINSSSLMTDPGAGNAGNVTINVSGAFTSSASTITTSAENAKSGDIGVTAASVALSNGTFITASSNSPPLPDGGGNAGNITVRTGSTFVMHNSSMRGEAIQASGGEFTITAPEMVRLTNSQISTSVQGGTGSGGNITIDPQFVILQNSQILAHAIAGSDGNIKIIAGVFLMDPASIVAASSTLSINTATSLPVSSLLTPLSQQFSSAAPLLTQGCAADSSGQFSSFVQTGRDGVPQVPGALSPSPLSFLETLTSGSSGSPGPNWAAARLGLDSVSDSTRFLFHSACRS